MTDPLDRVRESIALAGLSAQRQELLEVRLERWWDDLWQGLTGVYPPDEAVELATRIVAAAAVRHAERCPELLRLDLARSLDPTWFQEPRMVGYAAYADRFAGDLPGVRDRVGYLHELGVTYLHLMPLLATRDGDNDGGYAVSDYGRVRADLGTTADLADLASALRERGISLVLDLVLNHVAREHPWAQAARDGDPHYRAYFHIYPDRRDPDSYEQTLPEVFPDTAPGNFTHDPELGAWVWTTFHAWQWDLNWANPDVFAEFADIVCNLASLGVEVMRLDAIAFLWKRVGTNCQNQPEVHSITQALRALARIACPAVAFKAEAIVAPRDLVAYLGQGRHYGKVSDLAYHNSLMVHVWSMLASRDVRLAAHALGVLPATPAGTAWITYVRCHDDIGWAIDDADAAAVGLSGSAHRAFLSDFYAGTFPGSFAHGLVFQHNPGTGDRRISGMTASLAGLGGDQDEPTAAIERVLLAYALVFGWGGIPVIWMGDELGLRNDEHWAATAAHARDNRWVHRPPMPWSRIAERYDPNSTTGTLFAAMQHLVAVRAALPQLHAGVASAVGEVHDPGVLAVVRRHPLGPMVGLYNVSDDWRPYPAAAVARALPDAPVPTFDALAGRPVEASPEGQYWLAPRSASWLVPGFGSPAVKVTG